jgi:hypothetical protein
MRASFGGWLPLLALLAPSAAEAQCAGGLSAGTVCAPSATVGNLPACNASMRGAIYLATDAFAATVGSTVSGSSGTGMLVVCQGSSWVAY